MEGAVGTLQLDCRVSARLNPDMESIVRRRTDLANPLTVRVGGVTVKRY